MNDRYGKRFSQLRKEGRKAFIPFTLLGWPDRKRSLEIIKGMIGSGATALELGLAFSDPIADGPTIQHAAFETLSKNFKVTDAFDLLREVRRLDAEVPIGLLLYYNIILAHGIDRFFEHAAAAGVDAVLVADLPPEVADEIAPVAKKNNVKLIFIVSPLTTSDRLELVLKHAGAFLYLVSRLGITGAHERYDTRLKQIIDKVHGSTDLPVCVGFGISTPEQAHAMLALGADGVVTGSRIIDLVGKNIDDSSLESLKSYLSSMVQAVTPSPAE
jgi:tryptophan synthase alpha chain